MSFADFKLIGLHRFPTSLYMWGDNTYGMLGDNKTPSYFSWSKISSGGSHTVAIRNDGTLWGWGRNGEGQLGLADSLHRSFPTQISSVSWNQVSAGLSHTVAIAGDGTLWTWGSNRYGQIGDATTVTKSTLTQVAGSYIATAAGGNHTIAVRTDNTVFAWGLNNSGQLGDNTLNSKSSPVQVGATTALLSANAYSLSFNGSSQYLSTPYTSAFDLGTGNFTIECWFYLTADTAANPDGNRPATIFSTLPISGTLTNDYSIGIGGDTTTTGIDVGFTSRVGGVLTSVKQPTTVTKYQWHHFAVVRDSVTVTVYLDGVSVAQNTNFTQQVNSAGTLVKLGGAVYGTYNQYFPGYLSNFRLVKGTAVYTGAFTPSTTPLTAVSGTVLLTAQNTTIVDNSTNAFVITNTGSVNYSLNTPFSSAIPSGAVYASTVSAGKTHSVALGTNNLLYSWGDNTYGELGDSTLINRSAPTQIGNGSWARVSAGGTHTAAIETDGSLYTWGLDNYGQLGDQSGYSGYYWTSVAYGDKHTLAIRNDGTLWGWGKNNSGQLGQSDTITRSSPTQIGSSSWTQISAGLSHSIALRADGKLFAWGDNVYGQLGNDPATFNIQWSKISVGSATNNAFAIKNDGTLWGWGVNTGGILGDNTTLNKSSPIQIGTLNTWRDISSTTSHTLGITEDTTLYAWGTNSFGMLGDNTTIGKSSPVVVGYGFKNVTTGSNKSYALDINGYLYAWGYNVEGNLGDGTTIYRSIPVQIGNSVWKSIYAAGAATLGLRNDNTLWSWGYNLSGTLGLGDTLNRSSPVQIGTSSWLSVSAGATHVVAIASDYTMWAWGFNTNGELGQSDVAARSSPVQVGVGANAYSWTSVSAGKIHNLAIRTDGTLWSWGNNPSLQLGQGDTLSRSSPVQVGTATWTNAWAADSHSVAIDTTGAVYVWGLNTTGQLGTNDVILRSSPVQIGATTPNTSSPVQIGSSSWSQISAGAYHNMGIGVDGILYGWGRNDQTQVGGAILGTLWSKVVVSGTHTLAIKYDGTLWSWGANATGQLGDGTTVAKSSPIAVVTQGSRTGKFTDIAVGQGALYTSFAVRNDGKLFAWGNNSVGQLGIFSWKQVSVGSGHSLLLRNDGQLYAWGLNNAGQLGDATTVNKSVVTLVGLTSNSWAQVSAGQSTSAAIRSDGTLYTWGLNTAGQLGIASTVNKSSPIQVAGSWNQIALQDYALALSNQGSLWSWGTNTNGKLGLSDTANRKIPQLVDGTTPTYSSGFDGAIDYLSVPSSASLTFGTGDYTVECWVMFNSQPATTAVIFGITGLGGYVLGAGNSSVVVNPSGSGAIVTGTNPFALNTWYHIAAVRQSGSSRIFVNGRQVSPTTTDSTNYPQQIGLIGVGYSTSYNQFFPGYISNLRVCKGLAVYSGNFTVPTAPLTATQGLAANIAAITNQTVLLTLQDSTFKDNSTNNFTLTPTGAPQITKLNPVTNNNISTGKSWSNISAGSHSLGISNGSLYAWGLNTYGQLGVLDTVTRSSPVVIIHTDGSWTVASASMTGHSAAIDILGVLHTWGNNSQGELGQNNEYQPLSSPTQIAGYSYTQVSTGNNTTLATATVNNINTLFGFGKSDANQLNQIAPFTWLSVQPGAGIQASVGGTQGKLYVWGNNSSSQLGVNDTITRSSPVQIGGFYGASNYKTVITTPNNTVALTTDGTLYVWGDNTYGQLGQSDTISRSSPVQIGASAQWSTVVVSQTGHMLGISRNGTLFAWGNNTYNELGQVQSVVSNFSSPVIIGADADWARVGVANNLSIATKTNGVIYTWGRNDIGQAGVTTPLSYTNIGAYSAVRNDGKMVTWGVNSAGQLGLGDVSSRSAPTLVSSVVSTSTSWVQVAGSLYNRAAIKVDGKLFVWGDNTYGQLGQLDTQLRSAPIQVGTSSWTQVYVNVDSIFAIRSDNTLWAWGNNNLGQLGDGTTVNKSIPTQIAPDKLWSSVVAGPSGHAMAIRNDGTLWGWGNNLYNELGQNQYVISVNSSSPTQIGTGSYLQVTAGVNFTMALRTDYTLWGWGRNNVGQIGLNNNAPLSWTQITGGQSFAAAIRSDGKLYTWGSNAYGQLGLNHTSNRSTPVAVTYPILSSNLYSVLFNGTTDLLTIADNAAFNFAAGNFTIEAWIYPTTTSVVRGIVNNWFIGGEYAVYLDAANKLNLQYTNAPSGVSTILKTGLTSISSSQWTHFAVVRNGNNLVFYVNGQVDSSFDITGTTLYYYNAQPVATVIGKDRDGATPFAGNISNLRIVKGTAVYTGAFVVPTSSLSRIQSSGTNISALTGSETSLLTCQDEVLSDKSINNFTVTPTGTAISLSTPFAGLTSTGYSWTQVSATSSHAVALRNDGTLWTWGRNNQGQLAQGDTSNRSQPTQIAGSWSFVTTGKDSTFAINALGQLYVVGGNSYFQLGTNDTVNRSSLTQLAGSWTTISSSLTGHTLAIKSDSTLYAWGANAYNELGLNQQIVTPISSPTQVGTGSWSTISAGGNYSLGVKTDGTLWSWGYNGHGQVGNNSLIFLSYTQVSAGPDNWIATRNDGRHDSAGWDTAGQLSSGYPNFFFSIFFNGSYINSISYLPGGYSYSWSQLSTGSSHTVAIRNDGTLWGWGYNANGQLGQGDTVVKSSPVQIASGSWSVISAGNDATYAINTLGQLYVTGSNANGKLGLSDTINRSSMTQVGTSSWTSIAGSVLGGHVLGITSNGALFAWGTNANNELGLDWTSYPVQVPAPLLWNRSSPVQVGTSSWTKVSAGKSFSAAIRSDGALFTWGDNTQGQLGYNTPLSWMQLGGGLALRNDGKLFTWGPPYNSGQGDSIYRSTASQIPGTNSWISIGGGMNYSGAVRLDGTLWAWGWSDNGQAGDNGVTPATAKRSSPVQVGTESDWKSIFVSQGGSYFAIKQDSRMFAWGYNPNGNLGINDLGDRSSPVQVPGSWTYIAASGFHTAGISTDGTLWTWGNNDTYSLGLGDTIHRSTPTQVGNASWIQVIATSAAHNPWTTLTLGIQSNGVLYGWGDNSDGAIGDGTTVNKSLPTATSGGLSWTMIATPGAVGSIYGITNLGKLYTWGQGIGGLLGSGSTASRSLPAQVGTSSWSLVGAGLVTGYGVSIAQTLFGWGFNSNAVDSLGLIGDGTTVDKSNPTASTGMGPLTGSRNFMKSPTQVGTSSWTTVSAGGSFTAGISAFKLFTWGAGPNGELGGSSTVAVTATRSSPVQIGAAASSWTAVSASNWGGAAITILGAMWTWGNNTAGQVDLFDNVNKSAPVLITNLTAPANVADMMSSPVQVGALTTWSRVQAGTSWSAGLLNDGKLFMWGGSDNYELGVGTTARRSSPVQLGTSSWAVVGGSTLPIARTSLGTLFTWGNPNTSGQLGLGDTALRSQPVQITTPSLTGLTLDTIASPTQIGTSSWTNIAAGDSFVGAINTVGQLFTWGLGTTGQLGGSAITSRSSPVQVATPVSSWTALAAQGTSNMVAITTAYTLFSWGTGTTGQVGDGTIVTKSVPTAIGAIATSYLDMVKALSIPAAGSYIAISGGDSHVMAIKSDNTLWGWGKNDVGQLGNGSIVHRSSPVQIGAGTWSIISAGNSFTAGITTAGSLQTTGLNSSGQQGAATAFSANRSTLTAVGASLWSQVAAGASSLIGTTVSNVVFVWGSNSTGQLGLSDTANRSSPVQLGSSLLANMYQTVFPSPVQVNTYTTASWVQVAAGDSFASGIDNSGRLYTWGFNNVGQLGDGSTVNTMPTKSSPSQIATTASSFIFVNASSPVQVTGGGSYLAIAAGATHTVAIRNDNTLWGWGINTYGQVGNNSLLSQYQPKQVDLNNSYASVAAGTDFSAGINATDRTMWRWGYNASVDATSPHRSNPQQIGSVAYSVVSAANATAYAISTTGQLYEWGRVTTDDNFFYNQDITPTAWALGQSYINVNASDSYTHVIRNDYSLWAYGANPYGNLGTNDTITRSSPVQIAALQSWTLLGGGIGGPALSAGGLFRMGLGTSGQLGLGDATNRSSPTQIPAAAQNIYTQPVRVGTNRWSSVSAGATHTVALLSDSTLYAWGYNASGQVGDSTVVVKNSPVLISNSSYTSISAGKDHSVAVKIDNTIWAWGLNTSGQLGDNTNVTKSVPTLILTAGTGYWNSVVAGTSYTAALADNNTLWVWGDDNYG